MGLIKRFGQWSEIQKVRLTEELPSVLGGRDAELLLKQLVGASFEFKDAHLLAGRRIPSKRQGRRREIDLIVCTPRRIHLIEVKNWSGRLDVRDRDWRQTRRGGDVVEHGDLIATNLRKQEAVVEYLADRGLALDDAFVREHIVPNIIFMNPALELSLAVEALPEVISRRELDQYLGRQRPRSFTEQIYSSIIEFLLDSEAKPADSSARSHAGRIPSDQYKRIVTYLSETGTWDQLHFHGARIVTGDVLTLNIGPKTYRKPDLTRLAGQLPIKLRWTRGRFLGLMKALTGIGVPGRLYLGNTRVEVTPSDTVTFHAVGEQAPMSRRLVELDQIVMG